MKRSISAPVWALLLAACADVTGPTAVADLTPSYGRVRTAPLTVQGNLQNNTITFGAGGYSVSGTGTTSLTVEDQVSQSVTGMLTEEMPSHPGRWVLGRLDAEQVTVGMQPGTTRFEVSMDFYAIGSWDGRGQQAQHGAFGQDSWSISAVCGTTLVDIFTTSFSNQKAVQQHYPSAITGKAAGWLSGSSGSNYTGFDAVIPLFSSVKDSWYEITVRGQNPCGNLAFNGIRLLVPGFDLQGRGDESWAIGDLVVKTDSN